MYVCMHQWMLITYLLRVVRFICRRRDVDRFGGRHTLPSSESFWYVGTFLKRKFSTMVATLSGVRNSINKIVVNQQNNQK